MFKKTKRHIPYIIPVIALAISCLWFVASPTITEAEKTYTNYSIEKINTTSAKRTEKYILINLNSNTLTLFDKEKKIRTISLVSQGKPGSYYETIAGVYTSDYKIPLHFSTLGHVYMPYSVHLFGNYFIHGIPYYPSGEKVSSTYSGGCVRLNDYDAKIVYDFITPSTPVIITRENEDSFNPTATGTTLITSKYMTRLMVAFISLEHLNQDDRIFDTATSTMTRLSFLTTILEDSTLNVEPIFKDTMNNERFIKAMNDRAKSLGLSNTLFTDVNSSAITTEEDYKRFVSHILTYKSYLRTVVSR